jgi:hypothetical protein
LKIFFYKNAFPPRFDQQQKNNGPLINFEMDKSSNDDSGNNMVASNSTQESLAQSKK